MYRIGQGYDAHRLKAGGGLVLGGVEIEYEYGLEGHSDADVVTHALIDAMLGAAALGDIGMMYPDSDERYRGASSMRLLTGAAERVREAGYEMENADMTIIAERPKLAGYIERMRERVSAAAGVDKGVVSIKATTEEGMGYTGRGEGIGAQAVVMLRRVAR